ncbi:MAG: sigma-54-dependent transcriptional regulator [Solidesulfovibrio sp.]
MRILLVDDEIQGRKFLANYLTLLGHDVTQCESAEAALEVFGHDNFHMILSDIKMEGQSGIDLVRHIKKFPRVQQPDIVLYTGFIDVELAIGALRAGAYDYLTKPINFDELGAILDRVAEHQNLIQENDLLTNHFDEQVLAATREKDNELAGLHAMLAKQAGIENLWLFSKSMQEVIKQAEHYHTDRSIPVLIQGETGVGKEIVAKVIHYGNGGETRPFVDINCTAITQSLFESELFGYEGGAFSGGFSRGQKGKLDMAMGGSLFLDEIAEIPVELQAKLLRVLEEKNFYRVGGLKKIQTDIRVISATNLDFDERIKTGLFRRDLYYRLKVGQIFIPPLRERKDDIVNMGLSFLKDFSRKRGKQFSSISDQANELLMTYHWPGNVRELRNAMEWVSFMHDDTELRVDHFAHLLNNAALGGLPKSLKDAGVVARKRVEKAVSDGQLTEEVQEALKRCSGNKTRAARSLGISIRTLYYRLERARKETR